jgi:outer membrane protein OmpA-like peptidoglycan-associated protein/tetratricopeptide (TPR) repeat protein
MPKIKKIGITFILTAILCVPIVAQTNNSLLKDAIRHFELSSFVTAIPKFEQVLQKDSAQLSSSERFATLLQLAYSYKQVQNMPKAESTYRQALDIPVSVSGDQLKSYLYFAQVLVNNNKYKEAQEWFDKYNTLSSTLSESTISSRTNLANDVSALYNTNAKYLVEYLSFNTNKPEFSPMYYKNGLVFCSGKGSGSGLTGNKGYLDLYYLSDLAQLSGISEDELDVKKTKKTTTNTGDKRLGKDFYTRFTANDSKTLNFFDIPSTETVTVTPKGKIAESEVFSKTLNTKFHEGPATFSSDFSKIIFTRNNYNDGEQGKSEDNVTKLKLYIANFENGGWGEAQELPFNSDDFSTAHPAWSKDGKYLYFASDRKGGFGGMDIWVVEYNNGKWGNPVNLGKDINTKGTEVFPFVDDRGNLYYSSDGLKGQGGLDIFWVETQNGLATKKPFNIGEPFNSVNDDFGIITDTERKTGYFSSDRRRGEDDDIYRFSRQTSLYSCREMTVSIYDSETKTAIANANIELEIKGGTNEKYQSDDLGTVKFCIGRDLDYVIGIKKEGYTSNYLGYSSKGEADNAPSRLEIPLMRLVMTEPISEKPIKADTITPTKPSIPTVGKSDKSSLLKGVIKTEIEKIPIEGVLVTFRNECNNTTQQVVTGADGVYAFEMEDGCDYTLEVSKDGYGKKVNKITKVAKKGKNSEISQDLGLFKEGDVITMDNIYYDKGSAKIRKDAARELDKLAATLMKNPTMVIEIGSHTDSRGDAQVNLNLSTRRAQTAVDYIASKGIERNRMLAKGYGETALVNECADGVSCTELEHQKNRRTTVKFIKAKVE